MSKVQNNIINKLLVLASSSSQRTRVAAAICQGGKIISTGVNTHRNKYGSEVRCSGHAEVACIHKKFPNAFRNKLKGSYVL
jgi:deoxycytidylate deaminase